MVRHGKIFTGSIERALFPNAVVAAAVAANMMFEESFF